MADYIDREKLLDCIDLLFADDGTGYFVVTGDDIKKIPAADVAPVVRGHWLTWDEKFSSEQLLVTQENNNKVIISKAEAEAEALLIAAEAEAKANKELSDSLTPELISKQKMEKWNGVLPQIVSDSTIIKDFVD